MKLLILFFIYLSMKDKIRSLYNIDIDNFISNNSNYLFKYNNEVYVFTKIDNSILDELSIINKELIAKGIKVLPFILNIYHSYITNIDNNNYILVKYYKENEYGIIDIINRISIVKTYNYKSKLNHSNYILLWTSKNDYLEYQMNELKGKYKGLETFFDYYIGLAENALNYFKEGLKYLNKEPLTLSHKRMPFPLMNNDYDNSLNFILDYEVRDIGEYIKSEALKDKKNALIDLDTYLKINRPSLFLLYVLYSRLLYPTYFFDIEENIIEYQKSKELLNNININEYETFLYEAYLLISKYGPIREIDWLKKKL